MSINGSQKKRLLTLRTGKSRFNAAFSSAACTAGTSAGIAGHFYNKSKYKPGGEKKPEGAD